MSRAALEPGQILDETYRIVRRIGEGGMGEVYEATHARLAGRYAVKLLQKEVAEDPNLLARFQREAEVTSSLRHPNIVQVVDFRRLPAGTSYIVMEYLDGVDLAAEIRRVGALPLERVRTLVDQIATGLAAAHEQGIVHRDLKPANLFLIVLPGSRRELAKIVDFGISKVRAADTQLTRTATVMGTPQYMAPEQALGQSDRIDARSDQFALATITYEMIAGRCAFAGDTIPTVLYQLVHVEPPPLSVGGQPVHPALDAVVRRGLAKQPEARFATVLEFASAFDAAVAEALAGSAGRTAGVTTLAVAQTALVSQPAAVAPSPAPSPSLVAPARAALTTLGASAREAVPTSPASLDDQDAAYPRRSKLKPAVILGGTAAVGIGLVIVLVGSRGRSPEGRGPVPSAVPSAPAVLTAAGAPAPVAGAAAPTPNPSETPPSRRAGADQVTVSVADGPRDVVVSIDGDSVGPPPVRLVKDSGKHELRFEAPGYRSRTMQLDSTKDLALVLSLRRKGGTGTTPARLPAAEAAPAAATAAAAPASDPRAASAYVPPTTTTPSSPPSQASPPPPEKRKAGRFRHGVDAVSDFAKRHFGTAGSH